MATIQPKSPYEYIITRVELATGAQTDAIDVKSQVIEINIFEHLDRPYLSGNITFVSTNLFNQANFKGVERIRIGVSLPEDDNTEVIRTFYIDKITKQIRADDQQSVIVAHMMEDIGFISDHTTINQAFQGTGKQIITQLFSNVYGRSIIAKGDQGEHEETSGVITYIAPHISPLAIAQRIRSRMFDRTGSPYFLYSGFTGGNIYLQSLMDMIKFNGKVGGDNIAFSFGQPLAQKAEDLLKQSINIESYKDPEGINLSKIKDKGFLNTMVYFWDINRNQPYNPHHGDPTVPGIGVSPSGMQGQHWTAKGMFEVAENAIGSASAAESFSGLYPKETKLPWQVQDGEQTAEVTQSAEYIHQKPEAKRSISFISSQLYETGTSINDCEEWGRFLRLTDSNALRHWLTASPIEVVIPGRVFLSVAKGKQSTIGRTIKLNFTARIGDDIFEDTKRSGDHLVYAARHIFLVDGEGGNPEYKVQLSAVKYTHPDQVISEKIERVSGSNLAPVIPDTRITEGPF